MADYQPQHADDVRHHTPTERCPRTHPILLGCAICLAESERIRADRAEASLEHYSHMAKDLVKASLPHKDAQLVAMGPVTFAKLVTLAGADRG